MMSALQLVYVDATRVGLILHEDQIMQDLSNPFITATGGTITDLW